MINPLFTFMMGFQHIVLLIGRIIDWMVPDIPEEVEIKIKREHYMAKEALAENQVSAFKLYSCFSSWLRSYCLSLFQILSKSIVEDVHRQSSELRHRVSQIFQSPSPVLEDKPQLWQSKLYCMKYSVRRHNDKHSTDA